MVNEESHLETQSVPKERALAGEAVVISLVERLTRVDIKAIALDLDGTIHDPKTGISVPWGALESLKNEGMWICLASGSSPATMRNKLLTDGEHNGGVFSSIMAADGALQLKPETLTDKRVAVTDTVIKETPLPKEQTVILEDQLPSWVEENQDLIRFVAFHPTKESVGEGEVYGNWFYSGDVEERERLTAQYDGAATIVDNIRDLLQAMHQGAVKVAVEFKDATAMSKVQESIMPGQLSGVGWKVGGDNRVVVVADEVSKYQAFDTHGGRVVGSDFWQGTVVFGNDINDFEVMRRAAVAVVVNSRPEAAQALIKTLTERGYKEKVWLVEPEQVVTAFRYWVEKRGSSRDQEAREGLLQDTEEMV